LKILGLAGGLLKILGLAGGLLKSCTAAAFSPSDGDMESLPEEAERGRWSSKIKNLLLV